mmetsp:Transcript_58465/g.148199  ORF Transcript_58465/g.148199 Transcript_58465/m.148199 type:complete len:474 (-) Transcript_58465:68-1489(-)
MGKKSAPPPPRKGQQAKQDVAAVKGKKQDKPGLTKDAASNFLKQRLGKKVRDLRASDVGVANATTTAGVMEDALQAMQAEAQKRGSEFLEHAGGDPDLKPPAESEAYMNAFKEAENTRKRFWVELRKVLASADVIIEVLDARDPMACRNVDLEKEVSGAGKRLVLVLNKIDLVPKHAVEAWTKHLKRSFPTLAFKAAHGGVKRVIHAQTSAANAPDGLLQSTHAVVGADELMQLLKNYTRMGDSGKKKAHITVGIVGYPNTGKSSIINSMKRHCAVETGGRAGVTKEIQEVKLDSKVTLIDSPGIVFEGSSEDPSVVLRNVVRVEHVPDPVGVVDAMVRKAPRQALLSFYGMSKDFSQVAEFLIHVAQTRGKLRRGSGLDIPSAARSVISDWTTGKFRYYALPPAESAADDARAVQESAEILPALSRALDIDSLFSGQGDQPAVLGAPKEGEEGEEDDDAMGDDRGVEVDMDL